MTEHKLLRMIEEAGFDFTPDIMNKLQKFQNLIWVEREECAKICDAAQLFGNSDERWAAKCCSEAIRARGQR